MAEHEGVLAGRPANRQDALVVATDEMSSARSRLADMDAAAARSAATLHDLGSLAGLSRHGRDQRRVLQDRLEGDMRRAAAARARYEEIAYRVGGLRDEQDAFEGFETAKAGGEPTWSAACTGSITTGPRGRRLRGRRRPARLRDRPAPPRPQHPGRRRRAADAGIPDDRTDQWQQTRQQLPETVRQRRQAEELLADSRARLEDAGRRRWGRHDYQGVADAQAQVDAGERWVEQAVIAERELRERLGALAEHQERRKTHIADISVRRKELDTTVAQIDADLDRTRPNRVAALADDPPEHLVSWIGPAPDTPAGRAVWCHHALDIEADLDRNDGRIPSWSGRSPRTDRARHQIVIADRVLEASSDRAGPGEWAELAQQAGVILDQVRRVERNRATRQRTPGQWQQPQPWIDHAAERPQPGITR